MKEFTIYFSGSTTIAAPDCNTAVTAFWEAVNNEHPLPMNLYKIDDVEAKNNADEET